MATEAFTINTTNLDPPTGKNILITGGSSGLGLATSLLLASHSNHIVSLDRTAPLSQPSSNSTPAISHIPCDITSWPSQSSAFRTALTTHFPTQRLDAVYINAGVNELGNLLSDDLNEPDRRTLDIDLRHTLDTLKLAIYYLRADKRGQKGGSIVLTASLAGYLASAGAPVYSAAKHGIVGLMRALKGDCAKLGISIAVVAPAITLTPLVSGRDGGESVSDWGQRMKKIGVPINEAEEVARVVVWLFGLGMKSNGMGVLVQGGRCADVEAGIARSRGTWMGKEMLDLFRGGREAPLFPNKL